MKTLTSFERMKRDRLIAKLGNLSSSECLELAIEAEAIHKLSQFGDPAKIHFME